MLKSLLTSGFILELFSRMSFKHSTNVISNVVKGSKIKELRTTTEGRSCLLNITFLWGRKDWTGIFSECKGRRLRLWRVGNLNNALSVPSRKRRLGI